jgi:hypothetical protein
MCEIVQRSPAFGDRFGRHFVHSRSSPGLDFGRDAALARLARKSAALNSIEPLVEPPEETDRAAQSLPGRAEGLPITMRFQTRPDRFVHNIRDAHVIHLVQAAEQLNKEGEHAFSLKRLDQFELFDGGARTEYSGPVLARFSWHHRRNGRDSDLNANAVADVVKGLMRISTAAESVQELCAEVFQWSVHATGLWVTKVKDAVIRERLRSLAPAAF